MWFSHQQITIPTMSEKKLFMVFDVESIGLHGDGFAVGYVVVDATGKELASARYSCPPDVASGSDEARAWVAENIPSFQPTNTSPPEVRAEFWDDWREWSDKALLFADCLWPVEARFLAQCVDDAPASREWQGPYPFFEIASVLLAAGKNPTDTFERLPTEIPRHDPLADARQSARLLIENLPKATTPQIDAAKAAMVGQIIAGVVAHSGAPSFGSRLDDELVWFAVRKAAEAISILKHQP
jgi:hypothetical protein